MFTNQKIEAALWPWSTLAVQEGVDRVSWIENSSMVPTIMPQGGIGTRSDTRPLFQDTYTDLSKEVRYITDLSIRADSTYLR